MADNIIETNAPLEQQPQLDAKTELAQNMAIALGNGLPPVQQPLETPPLENIQPEVIVTPPTISFDTIKERFAYEKPEDAIKEIEEYRKFKENPIAEIEFENEQSRKLFEAIKGGKQKEAYAILNEQETLESITSAEINKDNAESVIKLGMKYKYKDLTNQEIDYKYKKQFSLPKEPIQTLEQTDEEFAEKHQEWKEQVADIEMDKVLEAKLIKPELEAHKSKLILPDIEASIDEDYVNWKKAQEQTSKIDEETVQAYKAFTPKSIETKLNFNDEANKVAFEFQDEPTVEELSKTVDMVTDINKFYQRFIGQDGKPDRQGFLKAIHFAVNADSILMKALKHAEVATLKAGLPDNTGAIIKHLPQGQEMSELDANMRRAGVLR